MSHDDDAGDDLLAGVDLHTWRVPPASAESRASILSRGLAPAGRPKRSRMTWLFAALAIGNVVLAALLLIVLSRPSPEPTMRVVAAGGPLDAQTQEVLRRLDEEQRQLESKLAELQQMRALVQQLSSKLEQCEQGKHEQTVIKTPPTPTPPPIDNSGCDEVSCVLKNYESGCCDKFKKGAAPTPMPQPSLLPEGLDREMISTAIAGVKSRISSCARPSVTGVVKAKVMVDAKGRVTSVSIDRTPDPQLGACVASAIQRGAKFPPTQQGGSFSYPFVF